MKHTVLGDETKSRTALAKDEAMIPMIPTPHLRQASKHSDWLLIVMSCNMWLYINIKTVERELPKD